MKHQIQQVTATKPGAHLAAGEVDPGLHPRPAQGSGKREGRPVSRHREAAELWRARHQSIHPGPESAFAPRRQHQGSLEDLAVDGRVKLGEALGNLATRGARFEALEAHCGQLFPKRVHA